MEKSSKNSLGMFEISRGLLMIAVVLGHSATAHIKYWETEYTLQWWYCFLILFKPIIYGVIPMFFIMSGYGFRYQKMSKCIRDKKRYLLKPYVVTGLVVTLGGVIRCLLESQTVAEGMMHYGLPFLLGLCPGELWIGSFYVGSIGPVWFLVVLALAGIVVNLLGKLEAEWLRGVCLLFMAAVCTQLPFWSFIPFCIVQALCCAGYLYMGHLCRRYDLLYQPLGRRNTVVLVLLALIPMLLGNVDVSQNVWTFGIVDYIAGAITGFLLLRLCLRLNAPRLQGRVTHALRTVGRYSLYILCVHTMEYLILPWDLVVERFAQHKVIGIVVTFAVRSVIIAAGSIIMKKCMEKRRHKRK